MVTRTCNAKILGCSHQSRLNSNPDRNSITLRSKSGGKSTRALFGLALSMFFFIAEWNLGPCLHILGSIFHSEPIIRSECNSIGIHARIKQRKSMKWLLWKLRRIWYIVGWMNNPDKKLPPKSFLSSKTSWKVSYGPSFVDEATKGWSSA
jgi:hypothetical protein